MTQTQTPTIDPPTECLSAVKDLFFEKGEPLTEAEVDMIDLWCEAGVISELIVEYLRPTSCWSVCVQVSTRLNRALSVLEISQVIAAFNGGQSAVDIASNLDVQPDVEPTEIPAP